MCKMPAQRTLVCGNLLKKYVVLVRLWQFICVCACGCVEILEPCVLVVVVTGNLVGTCVVEVVVAKNES